MRLLFLVLFFLLSGCAGFRFNAAMCDSMQPGKVSRECRDYHDEEAAKASLPLYDEHGECLRCKEPEKIEVKRK